MGSIQIMSLLERHINTFYGMIFIGLGEESKQNIKIIEQCKKFSNIYKVRIFIFGKREIYDSISNTKDIGIKKFEDIKKNRKNGKNNNNTDIKIDIINYIEDSNKKNINTSLINIILCNYPEKIMLDLMFSEMNISIIRGSISSLSFLKYLKFKIKSIYNTEIIFSRVALMETSKGAQFFYAPVGIDEVNSFEKKKKTILNMDIILSFLEIPQARISILSGGRKGDLGRDKFVDKTIKESLDILSYFQGNSLKYSKIQSDYILIESAIDKNSNFIIAPDGISGNLIYRTLVHLGGGSAFGALYTSIYLKYGKIIIDCSRVAEESEILGSLKLAAGFNSLKLKRLN